MLAADLFLLPVSFSPLSISPGHDVTRDTLIKFSRGTWPHHSPHGQDRLLCHSHTHHTHTHTHKHTRTHSASRCGVVRSPAACSVAHLTTGLFCVRFIFVDAPLSPCSPRTMGSFTCGQNQTHTLTWMQAFGSVRCWPFRSMETRVLTTGLSLVAMRRAFILTSWCYFRSNHNLFFLCLKGEYWYYLELTVYFTFALHFTCYQILWFLVVFSNSNTFPCQTYSILN